MLKDLIYIKKYRKSYNVFISTGNSLFLRNWQNPGKQPFGNVSISISALASALELAFEYTYSLLHKSYIPIVFYKYKALLEMKVNSL